MGVAADLGYRVPPPNPAQRVVQAVVSTRAAGWYFARTLPASDRAVARLTGGRTTLSGALGALPTLVLTTTGRRSGRRRDTQLVGIPTGDLLAVVGTNFGQAGTPAWVLNLEAHPRASVAYRGARVEVVAREASPPEREQVLARAREVYVGYPRYLERIAGRRVRVLVLDPAAPDPS